MYRVTVEETLNHTLDVEADTEEEAGELAIAAVVEDCDKHFMNVEDRRVKITLPLPEPGEKHAGS
jgi:hypothetical protein